ncbi:MAG: neutral/alkaline non-lysosomal ceramidase N-terminal domain-containing protein [Chitinophagales bacterium]|nr:neutral/alkaline non-lysosomal ceramidase N-terminal domain-containing protein [Chitinophagales bacterium]
MRLNKRTKIVLFFVFWLALAALFITPADNATPEQSEYYAKQMTEIRHRLARMSVASDSLPVHAGWSRVPLVPPFTTPIAIDAHRGGKHFACVQDSIYVRAVVFKQGNTKVAYISADLLIIPPLAARLADSLLHPYGYRETCLYYTATHTHSSIGGWADSYVGERFAGTYDPRVPAFIAQQICSAVLNAERKCSKVSVGFAEAPAPRLVYNRLVTDMAKLPDSCGTVDSMLRIIKLRNDNGETAAIVVFSAHNTVYHQSMMCLSGDWSGEMMRLTECDRTLDFCSFSAGSVASHGTYPVPGGEDVQLQYMAAGTAKIVKACIDTLAVQPVFRLACTTIPLYLRSPQIRLNRWFSLRPWLFYRFAGRDKPVVRVLQLGDLRMIGLPCDFSGEITIVLRAKYPSQRFLITDFNGGYIGYVVHPRHENLRTYETKTMNWFGPGSGRYMMQIIETILAAD